MSIGAVLFLVGFGYWFSLGMGEENARRKSGKRK